MYMYVIGIAYFVANFSTIFGTVQRKLAFSVNLSFHKLFEKFSFVNTVLIIVIAVNNKKVCPYLTQHGPKQKDFPIPQGFWQYHR